MKKAFTIISIIAYYSCNTIAQNFEWAKQMGGDCNGYGTGSGLSVKVDLSGNVYTTGEFWGTVDFDPDSGTYNLTSNGAYDAFVQKLDSLGHLVWVKYIGGTDYDEGCSLDIDKNGNVFITGYFRDTVDFDPGSGVYNLTSIGTRTFLLKN